MPRPKPDKVLPSPAWTWDMGISYSLLSRFINCRDRFHKHAVLGLRETSNEHSRLNSMRFGTYFHKLLEVQAKNPRLSSASVISRTAKNKRTLASISPLDRGIANMIFEEYSLWFADSRYSYIDSETVFDVYYRIPGMPKTRLVGKLDQIIRWNDAAGSLWLQENKTKEYIQEGLLDATIPFNLQTLMYSVAAELHYKKPIKGVVYNVIRKPKHRQKQGETDEEFIERIRQEIKKDEKHFFHRWEYPLSRSRYDEFRHKTFNPLLRQLHNWWRSIEKNPFDPWVDQNGLPNPEHYQRPFGVYDSMTNGEGDFFDLITRNNRIGITENNDPFPELKDERE